MAQLRAGGKTYEIHWVTGKVVGQHKLATTDVSGSGGGGPNASISISSSTTIHNDIFLVDASGKEHSFQLADFDIACRDGNELSVVWAIQRGRSKGSYIAVVNHTTSREFFSRKAVEAMYASSVGCIAQLLLLPIIFLTLHRNNTFFDAGGMSMGFQIAWSLIGWALIAMMVQAAILIPVAKVKAERFKSNFRLEHYASN